MRRRWLSLLFACTLAAALSGCGLLRPYASTPGAAVASQTVAASATLSSGPARQEVLDAFREIAFTSEYGGQTEEIRKWTAPIRAEALGSPTEEDLAALGRAMDGLNAVEGFPGISLAGDGGNMVVWFVPLGEMAGHVPGYVTGNWGFFSVESDAVSITRATVAIATDVTDQEARNHLIFEEVLQSTGLMQDSYRYADSIFYGRWTTVQQPTKMDWELLRMLYMPELKQGMPPNEAMAALDESYVERKLN